MLKRTYLYPKETYIYTQKRSIYTDNIQIHTKKRDHTKETQHCGVPYYQKETCTSPKRDQFIPNRDLTVPGKHLHISKKETIDGTHHCGVSCDPKKTSTSSKRAREQNRTSSTTGLRPRVLGSNLATPLSIAACHVIKKRPQLHRKETD